MDFRYMKSFSVTCGNRTTLNLQTALSLMAIKMVWGGGLCCILQWKESWGKSGCMQHHILQCEDGNWSSHCCKHLAVWTTNTLFSHSDGLPKHTYKNQQGPSLSGSWPTHLQTLKLRSSRGFTALDMQEFVLMSGLNGWLKRLSRKGFWDWTSRISQGLWWTNFAGMKNWNEKVTLTPAEWRNWERSKVKEE